jgi:hypothetical protein
MLETNSNSFGVFANEIHASDGIGVKVVYSLIMLETNSNSFG